jgi:hypothetical protein
MSIDQLQLGASVIFIRAFEAIYKRVISEKILRPTNKNDHTLNADLLLDSLREITDNSALDDIRGSMIVNGDLQAISIVVGILFAEGQRLWAERIRRKKEEQDGVAPIDENTAQPKHANIPERNLKKASDKRKKQTDSEAAALGFETNPAAVENIVSRFYEEPGSKVAPDELRALMERIKYLVSINEVL